MILLPKTGDVPQQKVFKGIEGSACNSNAASLPRGSRSGELGGVKGQVTGEGAVGQFATKLVFLRSSDISAKLQIMLAYDLRNVIAEGIGWIGIVNTVRNIP